MAYPPRPADRLILIPTAELMLPDSPYRPCVEKCGFHMRDLVYCNLESWMRYHWPDPDQPYFDSEDILLYVIDQYVQANFREPMMFRTSFITSMDSVIEIFYHFSQGMFFEIMTMMEKVMTTDDTLGVYFDQWFGNDALIRQIGLQNSKIERGLKIGR